VSATMAAVLGPAVLAWLLAGTACGFAYNFWFKDSPLSWAPYVVAFAILPPFVWSALDSYRSEFLWLYAVGAPLAVAAHLANSLPDVETDAAAGSAGLAVRLGRTGALVLLYACLLAPVAVIFASLKWLSYDSTLLAATLACYGVLVLASRYAYGLRPLRRGAALGFRLIAPAAVILAAGWLAAL
jgi:1,4-dihydroxy-2-naphthoate octaprenyltransferase